METFPNLVFVLCMLPFVVLISAVLRTRAQNFVVLIFSLVFLFWICSAKVVVILLFMSIFTQVSAVFICRVENRNLKFCVCGFTILAILISTIFVFNFVFVNVFLNLFFDFERYIYSLICMANVSYLIDIYKKHANLQKSFINFLTYVFMFPKLFLGPVAIYYKFNSQLAFRKVNFYDLSEGIELFIVGFAKKIVIANELYEIYYFVISQTSSSLSVLTAWLGAFSGFLSLVFNFIGYGEMAVGLGKMLGFKLLFNVKSLTFFNSVSEFFNRFNFSPLNYFKNYIFPWCGSNSVFIGCFKIVFIAFFMALLFGGFVECFVVAVYFATIILLEKFLFKNFLDRIFQNFIKFSTLIFLVVGSVLLQKRGIGYNLKYLGSMFGMSGVLIDFSYVFWIMFIKFLAIVFMLFFVRILKYGLNRIKFLNYIYYFKYFSLIILFLFSVFVSLSQI